MKALCGVLAALSFFLLAGIAGGLEKGTLTFWAAAWMSAVALVLMVGFTALAGGFKAE